MKIKNQHLIDKKILNYISKKEEEIKKLYKQYPKIEKFVRPAVIESEIVETILRTSIKTNDVMNDENNYFVSDVLYELACLELELQYLKNTIYNLPNQYSITVSKRKIDDTFKTNLLKVQGENCKLFYFFERSNKKVEIKTTCFDDDGNLLLNDNYKFYSFDSHSCLPSLFF